MIVVADWQNCSWVYCTPRSLHMPRSPCCGCIAAQIGFVLLNCPKKPCIVLDAGPEEQADLWYNNMRCACGTYGLPGLAGAGLSLSWPFFGGSCVAEQIR